MTDDAVLTALENGDDDPVSPVDLYHRWEAQHWRIRDLDLAADLAGWPGINRYVRAGVIAALARFSEGELAVTRTLAPIVYAAPTSDYQLYLATQVADEARHALFFRTYLTALVDAGLTTRAAVESHRAGSLFDDVLARTTDAVRLRPDDVHRWYEAVAVYHLLVEGTVAMTGLHGLLRMARDSAATAALHRGLLGVARDESRHVNFGVLALRAGVRNGFGDTVVGALLRHLPTAAETMVDPRTADAAPRLSMLAVKRAETLRARWEFAENSLARRLTSIGLPAATVRTLLDTWRSGCAAALDRYRDLHGTPHPVARY
ncbi:hypothetical protein ACWDSJ_18585 [Nocardia sp. NPDC003482]